MILQNPVKFHQNPVKDMGALSVTGGGSENGTPVVLPMEQWPKLYTKLCQG